MLDKRFMPATMFAAVALLFVAGSAIPEAFVDRPGGPSGPLVLVGCYLAARMLHAVALWHALAVTPVAATARGGGAGRH